MVLQHQSETKHLWWKFAHTSLFYRDFFLIAKKKTAVWKLITADNTRTEALSLQHLDTLGNARMQWAACACETSGILLKTWDDNWTDEFSSFCRILVACPSCRSLSQLLEWTSSWLDDPTFTEVILIKCCQKSSHQVFFSKERKTQILTMAKHSSQNCH